ncbi:hypothetical protein Hamer_G002958 [Homarus americanus]|uniref:Uncharacterized protein n=1 Tax=Homarus americanus TaxID=6706 RepID=A0A8J5JY73_HOMAM|nr:hypothetical protein Hamer_G002958 [Homarus americanus]
MNNFSSSDKSKSGSKVSHHSSASEKKTNQKVNTKKEISLPAVSKSTKEINNKNTQAKTLHKEKLHNVDGTNKTVSSPKDKAGASQTVGKRQVIPRAVSTKAREKETIYTNNDAVKSATSRDQVKKENTQIPGLLTSSPIGNKDPIAKRSSEHSKHVGSEPQPCTIWDAHAQTLPKDFVVSSWAKFDDFDWGGCDATIREHPVKSGGQMSSSQVEMRENKLNNDTEIKKDNDLHETSKKEVTRISQGTVNDLDTVAPEVICESALNDSEAQTESKTNSLKTEEVIHKDVPKIDDQLQHELNENGNSNNKNIELGMQITEGENKSHSARDDMHSDSSYKQSSNNVLPLPPRRLKEAMRNWVSFEDPSNRTKKIDTQKGDNELPQESRASRNNERKKRDKDKVYENVWFGALPYTGKDQSTVFDSDEGDEEFKVYASVKPFGDDGDLSSSFDAEDNRFAKIVKELMCQDVALDESMCSDVALDEKPLQQQPLTQLQRIKELIVVGPAEDVMQKPMRFDRIFKLDSSVPECEKVELLWQSPCSSIVASVARNLQMESLEKIPVLKHNFEYALCRFEIDYKRVALEKSCKVHTFSTPLQERFEEFTQQFLNEIPPVDCSSLYLHPIVEPIHEVLLAVNTSIAPLQNIESPNIMNTIIEQVQTELFDKCLVVEADVRNCMLSNEEIDTSTQTVLKSVPSNTCDEGELRENEKLTTGEQSVMANTTACVPQYAGTIETSQDPVKDNQLVYEDVLRTGELLHTMEETKDNVTQDLGELNSEGCNDDIVNQHEVSICSEMDHSHSFVLLENVNIIPDKESLYVESNDASGKNSLNGYLNKDEKNTNASGVGTNSEDRRRESLHVMHAMESMEQVELEFVSQEMASDPLLDSGVTFIDPQEVDCSDNPILFINSRRIGITGENYKTASEDKTLKYDASRLDIPQILIHAPSDEMLAVSSDSFLHEECVSLPEDEEYPLRNDDNYLEAFERDDSELYCTSDVEDIPVCSLAEEEMLRALMYASAEEGTQEFIDVFVINKSQYQLPERVHAKPKKIEREPLILAVVEEEMSYMRIDPECESVRWNKSVSTEDKTTVRVENEGVNTFSEDQELFAKETEVTPLVFTPAVRELCMNGPEILGNMKVMDIPEKSVAMETIDFNPLAFEKYEKYNVHKVKVCSEKLFQPSSSILKPVEDKLLGVKGGKVPMAVRPNDELTRLRYVSPLSGNEKSEAYTHSDIVTDRDSEYKWSSREVGSPDSQWLSSVKSDTVKDSFMNIDELDIPLIDSNVSQANSVDSTISDVNVHPPYASLFKPSCPLNTTGMLLSRTESLESQSGSSVGGDVVSVNNAAVLQYWAGVMKDRRNLGNFGAIADFSLEDKNIKSTSSVPIPEGGSHSREDKNIANLLRREESFVYFLSCSPESAFDAADFQLPLEDEEEDWLQELEDVRGEDGVFDSEFEFGEMEIDSNAKSFLWGKLSPKCEDKVRNHRKKPESHSRLRLKGEASELMKQSENEERPVDSDLPKQGGWIMDGIRHTTKGLYNLLFYGQTPGVMKAEENPVTEGEEVTEWTKLTDDDAQQIGSKGVSDDHTHLDKRGIDSYSQLASGNKQEQKLPVTHTASGGVRPKALSSSSEKISKCVAGVQSQLNKSTKDAVCISSESTVESNHSKQDSVTDLAEETPLEGEDVLFLAQVAGISHMEESDRAALHLLLTKVLQLEFLLCVKQCV